MASLEEVKNTVNAIKSVKNNKIVIMHSVSGYPTPENEVNLQIINNFKKKFSSYPIGFSDNGSNNLVPQIAVAVGAKIIEKHFTLDKKMEGPDHKISANPNEFKKLVQNIREIEEMLGDEEKKCQPSELKNRIAARRSIITSMKIKKNTTITEQMLSIKRPATGIEPKFFFSVLGKKAKRNLSMEKSLKWNDIV